jgi:hypothetical protein
MKEIALFIKSYRPDLPLVRRFLDSAAKYNRDQIGVFISVPAADVAAFENVARRYAGASVIADDFFELPEVDRKIWGFGSGYISQQLVKLSVQRLAEARNYLVLDSDTYFIRNFTITDFITPDGIGLTVLAEDRDLMADPAYAPFAVRRPMKIDLIADRLGMPAASRITCHNNTVFQDQVLRDFHDWRLSEGLSLLDLMEISPVEFSWYNLFLVKHHPELLVRTEPFIRMMHTRSEYRRLVSAGFTHQTLRRAYLGVCLNSGWAGTRQDHLVSRLERGSWTARFVISSDRVRYKIAQESKFFRDAQLRRLSRALERISLWDV